MLLGDDNLFNKFGVRSYEKEKEWMGCVNLALNFKPIERLKELKLGVYDSQCDD